MIIPTATLTSMLITQYYFEQVLTEIRKEWIVGIYDIDCKCESAFRYIFNNSVANDCYLCFKHIDFKPSITRESIMNKKYFKPYIIEPFKASCFNHKEETSLF
jgi:hypothetical protein